MDKISIVICTYNGENLIKNCLDSIISQDYPNKEIICVDGGSLDSTLKIISNYKKKYPWVKLIKNKNKLPEGKYNGKWQGYKVSKGKLIAFIDQDNVLQDNQFFKKSSLLLTKNKSALGVLAGLKNDLNDERVVRFVSLFGTDAFFAYRSLDFLRNLPENKNLQIYKNKLDNMTITGGNCFIYRREDLDSIGGYTRDVFTVRDLIKVGKNEVIIIPDSTKHYAEKNLLKLIQKKFFWSKKFKNSQEDFFNYMPQTKLERREFLKNIFFNLTFFPNFIIAKKIYGASNDPISLIFPYFAFANTLAYFVAFIRK